jgi:hypothetical protein
MPHQEVRTAYTPAAAQAMIDGDLVGVVVVKLSYERRSTASARARRIQAALRAIRAFDTGMVEKIGAMNFFAIVWSKRLAELFDSATGKTWGRVLEE